VFSTASGLETDVPALVIKGTHADNALEMNSGEIGVGFFGGEATTLKTIDVNGGTLRCGANCTLNGTGSKLTVIGGEVFVESSLLDADQHGGAITIYGSSSLSGALNLYAGTFHFQSSGTIATANIYDLLDASDDLSDKTITNTTIFQGGRIVDPARTITHTNGISVGGDVLEVAAA